ncbi:MAG: cation acetate symporter [Verrucomicrobia subdivision 3 bacterium]|nr:cation acetate symporter [Limisphaerales bacterium]
MDIDPWILTFSALTVVVTIWMGFWSARKSKTAGDFFVAGRSVSVGWNASAISGEYLSAASFMGVAGMVMSSGYDTLWYPVCYACGYLFLLLFIAGPLRRFGAYTIPDFAEGRFDSPMFRKIAVTFVLFIGFFYTMPQMKGAGTTLAYIFPGLPYWAGVVLVGAVITLNVALGGMKGITLVQAFQYWLKMFAISVPIFVLMAVYGHYGEQLKVNDAPVPKRVEGKNFELRPVSSRLRADMTFAEILAYAKYKLSEVTGRGSEVAGHLRFTDVELDQMLPFYEALGGAVVFKVNVPYPPNKYTLLTTNPVTRSEAKRLLESEFSKNGIGVLAYGESVLVVCPVKRTNEVHQFLSSFEFVNRQPLPDKAPKDATWISPFGPLTTKAAQAAGLSAEQGRPFSLLYTYSLIIALVCGTAGLPHILVRFYTNPDGVAAKRTTMWVMILIGVFYLFPPVFGVMGRNLLPELYAATGAKGTDKIVLELPRLLNEQVPMLGSIMSGITCAGAFAAFMSTFSGLLVSITGALAHDIYGRILRPRSSANERMKAFKVFAVVGGACAILLGFLVESFEINKLVGWAFAIAATSYFPLLFLSTWWRRITITGAATGMLVGGTLSLAAIASTMFADQAKWAIGLKTWFAQHPLERTLAEQPAIWALPLAIILMIVISKFTQKTVPSDIRMKMLVLHAPEKLGLKQEYIQEHQSGH